MSTIERPEAVIVRIAPSDEVEFNGPHAHYLARVFLDAIRGQHYSTDTEPQPSASGIEAAFQQLERHEDQGDGSPS